MVTVCQSYNEHVKLDHKSEILIEQRETLANAEYSQYTKKT